MTPIERACRALADLHGRDPDEPVLLTDRRLWQEFEPQVRAVVAAIREPSEGMRQAGLDAMKRKANPALDHHDVHVGFTAAIDALLEEGK